MAIIAAVLAAAAGLGWYLWSRERRARRAAEAAARAAQEAARISTKVAERQRVARQETQRELDQIEVKYQNEIARLQKVEQSIDEAQTTGSGADAVNAAFQLPEDK